jgi:hypothetical protein
LLLLVGWLVGWWVGWLVRAGCVCFNCAMLWGAR